MGDEVTVASITGVGVTGGNAVGTRSVANAVAVGVGTAGSPSPELQAALSTKTNDIATKSRR